MLSLLAFYFLLAAIWFFSREESSAAGSVSIVLGRKRFWRVFWGFLGDDWVYALLSVLGIYCSVRF